MEDQFLDYLPDPCLSGCHEEVADREEEKRKDIENFVKSLYEGGSSPCESFGVTLDQLAELEERIEEAKERMKQHSDKTIGEFEKQLQVPYPEDNDDQGEIYEKHFSTV